VDLAPILVLISWKCL